MGRYRVVFRRSVGKDLQGIPNRDVRRVLAAIVSLSEEPRAAGSEKLSGHEKSRVRQGDYRIIYEIHDDVVVVVVVKAGQRRKVYRGG